jgi:hypothetical protein
VKMLSQYLHEDLMVQHVKTFGDISLDKPPRSTPSPLYFREGRMAASVWSEAVGTWRELWLEVCFQDGAHNFLQQLI